MLPNTKHEPQHSFPLQIKIISLADEARTIRRIENKLKPAEKRFPHLHDTRMSLRDHRKEDIARESRATALAYAFLKGKPYTSIEAKRHSDPDWAAIERMISKYYTGGLWPKAEYEAWKLAAGKPTPR